MPRLRWIDVDDHADGGPHAGWGDVLNKVAECYQLPLAESGLQGPSSSIALPLHAPEESTPKTVTVLVYCDKPEGGELMTTAWPFDVMSASTSEVAALLGDVFDAGLKRLGVARDWDEQILAKVLQSGRVSTRGTFGSAPPRWDVVAVGRGSSAPEQPHEIHICGGGPTNGVPKAYLEELNRLLDVVAGDTWKGWWAESPVKLAEVFYWFDRSKVKVQVRVGTKVTGSIERPIAMMMMGANPVDLARADVSALTQRLTARLKLPEPPRLV